MDGGIVALLIASLGYGIYKVYKFNYNKKTQL
ncbi:PID-CTERM protein-sorting domain-containing protein [Flavobacterium longum]